MIGFLSNWQNHMPKLWQRAATDDGGLRRSAIKLALAGGIEYGLQLAMPIILVRYLDQTAFGQYRFLWLLAGSVLAIAPAFMPQALFYFLPRAEPGKKGVFIGNVLIYLITIGCVVSIIIIGGKPFLPEIANGLFAQSYGLSIFFLALWMVASLLDVLPIAEGNAYWESNSTIGLALLRTILLTGAAFISSDIGWVVFGMLIVAITKLMLLAYYVMTKVERLSWQISIMKKQLFYCVPFAIGNALFLLRTQADQWVVASMLSPAMYATFSIAAVFLPLATLIRQPVYSAMMPHLNKAHASGNFLEIQRLIKKTNGATALLLIPVAGMLLAGAPELVRIIYTHKYQHAAPVMEIYLVGMMMNAFAVSHVLPALDKGRFAVINSICSLLVSVTLNIVGVIHWGLIGAAMGSVFTFAFSELWSVQVVSRTLGVKMHQLLTWSALFPSVLAICFALYGVSMVKVFGSWNVFLTLLIKEAVYFILFVPCFLLTGGYKQFLLFIGTRQKAEEAVDIKAASR